MSTLVPPSIPFQSFNLGTVSRQRSPFNLHRGDGHKDLPPLFITQRQGVVARQTIPLASGGDRGGAGGPLPSNPLLPTHPHILPSAVHLHTTSRVRAQNELVRGGLRAAFYWEEIAPSSLLQLGADQLMTANEARRDICAGALAGLACAAARWLINYELQLAANPSAEWHSAPKPLKKPAAKVDDRIQMNYSPPSAAGAGASEKWAGTRKANRGNQNVCCSKKIH